MNVLNRLIVVIVLIALIAAAISVAVLAWTIPNDSISSLRDAVDWLSDHNQDLEKSILAAGAGAVALIALILLALELMPRSTGDVKVTDLKAGNAYLSTTAISQRVEEAVAQVPHVSDVKAMVTAKKKGVLVNLDLHVDPQANLATVTDDACLAATDVLTNRVHVALIEPPRARLHYRELRMQRAVANQRPVLATSAAPIVAAEPATVVTEPALNARPVALEAIEPPVTNNAFYETSSAGAATAVEERPAELSDDQPHVDSKPEDR